MFDEFEITQNGCHLRLENWRTFLTQKSLIREQKAKNSAIFVTYNLSDDALITIDALSQCDELDIVVVDNCSSKLHSDKLLAKCCAFQNISLLILSENLGGAGGYAVGLEYILSRNYDLVLITEDDAQLRCQSDVIKILKHSSRDVITSIWFSNNSSTSFNFHWMVYPVRLLKEVGVPDPRYFMRSDDFEFGMRVKAAKNKLLIKDLILRDIEYIHPIVKENKTVWMEYFSTRNSMESYVRHRLIYNLILEPLKKIPYSIFKILKNFDASSAFIFFFALTDFVFSNFSLDINRRRILDYRNISNVYPCIELHNMSLSEFNGKYSEGNNVLLGSSLKKIMPKLNGFTKGWSSDIFRYDTCILAGYFSPMLPLAYLFRKIIVIANLPPYEETVSFYILEGSGLKNRLIILLALILSFFLFLFVLPIILLKYFFYKYK